MNKNLYFENQAKVWAHMYDIDNLDIKPSKVKFKETAYAQTTFKRIRYSSKNIKKLSKIKIIHTVLHEIGHLMHSESLTIMKGEYEAEKFALKNIKRYLPKYYKKALKTTEQYTKISNSRPHTFAFAKLIKELKNEKT